VFIKVYRKLCRELEQRLFRHRKNTFYLESFRGSSQTEKVALFA
jgi:hypothetical protein